MSLNTRAIVGDDYVRLEAHREYSEWIASKLDEAAGFEVCIEITPVEYDPD